MAESESNTPVRSFLSSFVVCVKGREGEADENPKQTSEKEDGEVKLDKGKGKATATPPSADPPQAPDSQKDHDKEKEDEDKGSTHTRATSESSLLSLSILKFTSPDLNPPSHPDPIAENLFYKPPPGTVIVPIPISKRTGGKTALDEELDMMSDSEDGHGHGFAFEGGRGVEDFLGRGFGHSRSFELGSLGLADSLSLGLPLSASGSLGTGLSGAGPGQGLGEPSSGSGVNASAGANATPTSVTTTGRSRSSSVAVPNVANIPSIPSTEDLPLDLPNPHSPLDSSPPSLPPMGTNATSTGIHPIPSHPPSSFHPPPPSSSAGISSVLASSSDLGTSSAYSTLATTISPTDYAGSGGGGGSDTEYETDLERGGHVSDPGPRHARRIKAVGEVEYLRIPTVTSSSTSATSPGRSRSGSRSVSGNPRIHVDTTPPPSATHSHSNILGEGAEGEGGGSPPSPSKSSRSKNKRMSMTSMTSTASALLGAPVAFLKRVRTHSNGRDKKPFSVEFPPPLPITGAGDGGVPPPVPAKEGKTTNTRGAIAAVIATGTAIAGPRTPAPDAPLPPLPLSPLTVNASKARKSRHAFPSLPHFLHFPSRRPPLSSSPHLNPHSHSSGGGGGGAISNFTKSLLPPLPSHKIIVVHIHPLLRANFEDQVERDVSIRKGASSSRRRATSRATTVGKSGGGDGGVGGDGRGKRVEGLMGWCVAHGTVRSFVRVLPKDTTKRSRTFERPSRDEGEDGEEVDDDVGEYHILFWNRDVADLVSASLLFHLFSFLPSPPHTPSSLSPLSPPSSPSNESHPHMPPKFFLNTPIPIRANAEP
ncbi:hypothetical protein SISNIDRAFT_552238, partial [Sistotremastrum niveocremeum HHB9708]